MKNKIENQNEPIKGKVSGILNARELIINIGSEHGVHKGMKFKILADKPMEVNDPDSNELLGTIDREKVQVQAFEVYEKFSICKTFRKSKADAFSISTFMDLSETFLNRQAIPETLKAEDSALLPALSEEESYVKKGDRAVQIVEDEEY